MAGRVQQFSPDFFDLVIVDEYHPESAAADFAWRMAFLPLASLVEQKRIVAKGEALLAVVVPSHRARVASGCHVRF